VNTSGTGVLWRAAVSQTAIGLFALAVAGCALGSRYLPITNHAVLITAAFSPYLMLCGPISVVLLIVARRWVLLAVAVALTATTLAVQLPQFLDSKAPRILGATLRVMSANLRLGQADANQLVTSAREQADVVALQELTLQAVDRLSAAGLDATFPYRWQDPGFDADGVGIWSRFPMHETMHIGGYIMPFLSARLRVPGVSPDLTVLVAHMPGPWPQPIDGWRQDLDRLPVTLREIAERGDGGCVIVAGDLNSTTDMRPFRGLLRDGYHDAAEQSGAGQEPTFPADSRLPPLLAIDHVLTRNCWATSLHTVKIRGSDHRGVVANVVIPKSPASR